MHESWLGVLADELAQPYMVELRAFLVEEIEAGRRFFPPADRVFNAMALTPFDAVRVVILGQDPYHGPGQAMGLCFSVPPGVPQPPSLQNIFKELASDLGVPAPSTGDLTPWAERGVLLLNAVLTVSPRQRGIARREGLGALHRPCRGGALVTTRGHRVPALGSLTRSRRGTSSTASRHHVLTAAHPSPYSAASGFFGCRHFSQANALLEADGRDPVDWQLP